MCESESGRPIPDVVYDRDNDIIKDPSGYVRVYPGGITWADSDAIAIAIAIEGDSLEIPLSWLPTVLAAIQAATARCAPVRPEARADKIHAHAT